MHSSFWWVINFLEIMFDNYSKKLKPSEIQTELPKLFQNKKVIKV